MKSPLGSSAEGAGRIVEVALGPGRSIGLVDSKPNAAEPAIIACGPIVSVPIWANALLHDRARIVNSVPPHVSPEKLEMGAP